jgi:hypothetical protein
MRSQSLLRLTLAMSASQPLSKVYGEWAQAELLGHVEAVGSVAPAADPDDAVVLSAFPVALDASASCFEDAACRPRSGGIRASRCLECGNSYRHPASSKRMSGARVFMTQRVQVRIAFSGM